MLRIIVFFIGIFLSFTLFFTPIGLILICVVFIKRNKKNTMSLEFSKETQELYR